MFHLYVYFAFYKFRCLGIIKKIMHFLSENVSKSQDGRFYNDRISKTQLRREITDCASSLQFLINQAVFPSTSLALESNLGKQ